MSLRPIVVGTDLSNASAEAIRQAAAWSTRTGAPLVVVHVAPDEIFRALEADRVLGALRARIEAIAGAQGAAADVVLEAGTAHSRLVHVADERNAELVVVAASGVGAVERALFGTTAEHVVRYAHCPVLVARPSPADGPVLAATDFSPEALPAVEVATKEARQRAVPLRLVHCLHEPVSSLALLGPMVMAPPTMPEVERQAIREAAEQTLASILAGTGVAGASDVIEGPPAHAIAAEASALGAGLVVVATRGRTGLSRIALGSVAEGVVRHAPCSVLAVRRPPERG